MDGMKILFQKHREVITYIFWGVMTTICNYAVYWVCTRWLHVGYLSGNLIAWIFAVIFAYVTNKSFVFRTPWSTVSRIFPELLSFVSGRIASLLIETVILYLLIDLMRFDDIVVKLFSNIIVVVLNYIFAKLFTFRETKKGV